ncbi:hypothetical protein QJ043_07260 [Olsenella sp. YH-ols2217]|uniref:Uncharacterized protein n=1 Tax=Kribbibacterium absianum TaxID=3044210 RepID=A0ABT6ZLE7_9ACTN|nr:MULTISPECIES: hypothetical protein [unclassified Olsenella]MDJ1121865.1 hypothetical protein [Olsenella sp. YH-ols2216]MDJ1129873.1 hypothetical protein [Olsenella sp. YH-ols2217]
MTRPTAKFLSFLDEQVTDLLVDKYGFTEREALARFLNSKTYQMLLDKETLLYRESPLVLLDLWEAEQVTGDPRRSAYIREL